MSTIKALIQNLERQGITHPAVLEAIANVPREKFVLPHYRESAYDNTALPINCQQTISQPYIVALMSQVLLSHPHPQKILEIGTGSGYQAAILATLFKEVWTIERIESLYLSAQITLKNLGLTNIHYKLGDGAQGWAEYAPFDTIIVTAAANKLPVALFNQLEPKQGLMVIPLGEPHQVQLLTIIKRKGDEIEQTVLEQVCFVPLIEEKSSDEQ